MKKILLIIYITITAMPFAFAQDINDQVKSLQLNSSPAYVVLGVEPENIQRPNSPTDFLAGVQSAVVNEKLQPNFAMETSPYYWFNKKKDPKKFNAADFILNNNFGQNLARSITLSFATSASDTVLFGKIKGGTGLGLGLHLQLFQGSVSKKTKKNLTDWYESNFVGNNIQQLKDALETGPAGFSIDDVDEWLNENMDLGSNKSMPDFEKEIIKNIIKSYLKKDALTLNDTAALRKISGKLATKAEKALYDVNENKFPLTREGFMLELAIANGSVAPESKWNQLQSAKTSIWITPSYRFNVNKDPEITEYIDLMAVARITFNSKEVDSANYVDVGGKLQWVHNRFSLSGEAIYRYLSHKPDSVLKNHTVRTAFTISYKINELITFKATFGSNFNGNSTTYSDPSKMFAVGGFNFGFSNFFKKSND